MSLSKKIELKKIRRVVISTHVRTTGPSHYLASFLKENIKEVVFISHPFNYNNDTRSSITVYRDGQEIKKTFFKSWSGHELTFYLKDLFLSIWWGLRLGKIDLFIGVDSLNCLAGDILRKFGAVKNSIFYTIDYVPQRTPNFFLNKIYHWMDRQAVKTSDKVWNLSKIMVQERLKNGLSEKYASKQIEVPIGTKLSPKELLNSYDENLIVFMGHMRDGQGVFQLLEAFKIIYKYNKKYKLIYVGSGPLEQKLKNLIKDSGLQGKVKVTGFVENFSDVEKWLRKGAVAVAPYENTINSFTRYTDPGKPKDYLANALPVIITDVPLIAKIIDRKKAGIIVEDNPQSIADGIIKLLENKKTLLSYRKNAYQLALKYTWNEIFTKALLETLSNE